MQTTNFCKQATCLLVLVCLCAIFAHGQTVHRNVFVSDITPTAPAPLQNGTQVLRVTHDQKVTFYLLANGQTVSLWRKKGTEAAAQVPLPTPPAIYRSIFKDYAVCASRLVDGVLYLSTFTATNSGCDAYSLKISSSGQIETLAAAGSTIGITTFEGSLASVTVRKASPASVVSGREHLYLSALEGNKNRDGIYVRESGRLRQVVVLGLSTINYDLGIVKTQNGFGYLKLTAAQGQMRPTETLVEFNTQTKQEKVLRTQGELILGKPVDLLNFLSTGSNSYLELIRRVTASRGEFRLVAFPDPTFQLFYQVPDDMPGLGSPDLKFTEAMSAGMSVVATYTGWNTPHEERGVAVCQIGSSCQTLLKVGDKLPNGSTVTSLKNTAFQSKYPASVNEGNIRVFTYKGDVVDRVLSFDKMVVLNSPAAPVKGEDLVIVEGRNFKLGGTFEVLVDGNPVQLVEVSPIKVVFRAPASGGTHTAQLRQTFPSGVLTADVTFQVEGSASVSVAPKINRVTNGASFEGETLVPGMIATVFGGNFGQFENAGQNLRYDLGGATVTVCYTHARMIYNTGGDGQINFVVPALAMQQVDSNGQCNVTVTSQDASGMQISKPFKVKIVPQNISLMTFALRATDGTDINPRQPIITGQDWSYIGPWVEGQNYIRPAKRGEYISFWTTGGGATNPYVPDWEQTPETGAIFVQQPKVIFGGMEVPVAYAGRAPTLVGVDQIVVRVPEEMGPGEAWVSINEMLVKVFLQ